MKKTGMVWLKIRITVPPIQNTSAIRKLERKPDRSPR